MSGYIFKKISVCKVAPLFVPHDVDGLGRQKCPVELFRARRGFEQTNLNFLTTVAEKWDGQTSTSGVFYELFCNQPKTIGEDLEISSKNGLEMDNNSHASFGQMGKPRKFRPRKIFRKLAGKLGNKVSLTSG